MAKLFRNQMKCWEPWGIRIPPSVFAGKHQRSISTRWMVFWIGLCALLATSDLATAQTDSTKSELSDQQQRLAEQYRQLESKLFSLYEFEKESNPARSQLLQRAYQVSQKSGTAADFVRIVALLEQSKLKEAETGQTELLKDLQALLDLLQSEDRTKRVRDDLLRHQEYLEEVESLQRLERSIRGAAESQPDKTPQSKQQLAKQQSGTAQRTGELANKIKQNEEPTTTPPSPEGSTNTPSGSDSKSLTPPVEPQSENQPPEPSRTPHADGGKSGEPTTELDAGNPVRKKLEAARERMQQAEEQLKQTSTDAAIEDMRAAERELAEAKRQLEEILRQLREEEVGRTLASLESRFRNMLEREIKIREQSSKLNGNPDPERVADILTVSGKLGLEQKSVAAEAARAQLLLEEDGTSLALLQTVNQLHSDMIQVAEHLSNGRTGTLTIELEDEIIESLQTIVDALVRSQKDLEQKRDQPPPGQSAKPGQRSLVDLLTELKMVRSLQDRINRRHQKYSELLANPRDPIGHTDRPDLREGIRALAERQKELVEITRGLKAKLSQE